MKKVHLISVLTAFLFTLGTAYAQDQQQHKLVFQLVNGDSLSQFGLMKNLTNLTSGWPELSIEVVCHGPGLFLLHKDKSRYAEKVKVFSKQGVKFVACENTMKSKKVERSEIFEEAHFVPMGIKEIVLKQEQGWSYIKDGVVR